MAPDDTGRRLAEFLNVMQQLRAECSWKREQTHRSLARYLLEETQETLEAIDTGDSEHLCEELGDMLLQVYFHAVIAEEAGEFTLDDVAAGIIDKMRRRNPHVFAPAGHPRAPGADAATVNQVWESIKATEKPRSTPTDGLPTTLPALLYADKVLDRLARSSEGNTSHLEGQYLPLRGAVSPTSRGEGELGDRLLALVAEARETGVDPEQALRDAVRRLLADPTTGPRTS